MGVGTMVDVAVGAGVRVAVGASAGGGAQEVINKKANKNIPQIFIFISIPLP